MQSQLPGGDELSGAAQRLVHQTVAMIDREDCRAKSSSQKGRELGVSIVWAGDWQASLIRCMPTFEHDDAVDIQVP
jgi:hypothetical protein